MNNRPITLADDPDLRNSLPAMKRAALRAREIAKQTSTGLVVVGDDGLVKAIPSDQIDREDEQFRSHGSGADCFPDDIDDSDLGEDVPRDSLD